MGEIGAIITMLSLIAALPSTLYYYRKLYRLIEALKEKLPEQFEALHRPNLGFGMSIQNSAALLGYILKSKHQTSGVEAIMVEGEKAKKGLYISSFCMAIMFIGATLIMLSSQ